MKLILQSKLNEFSTKNLDLCTNIPNTLVVILTERHKVIGDTPVPQKYASTQQQADPSNESLYAFRSLKDKFFRPFSSGYATCIINEN